MKSEKSVGLAIILWLFFGGFGAHRVYAKDSAVTILWYWLATICTLTIILWVDLFLISGWIKKHNEEAFIQNRELLKS